MIIKKKIHPILAATELSIEPVVIRVHEFDTDTADYFAEKFSMAQSTGQSVIPVVIDSFGGEVYSLMSMIGVMRASSLPVATIVMGKAMSCGAVLAALGTPGMRYMDPEATIMIHEVSSMYVGKSEEIKSSAAEAERLNQKIFHFMAAACNKPEDYFMDIVHKKKHADWYLDAEEALKHGIVDHLKLPSMTVHANLRYRFG